MWKTHSAGTTTIQTCLYGDGELHMVLRDPTIGPLTVSTTASHIGFGGHKTFSEEMVPAIRDLLKKMTEDDKKRTPPNEHPHLKSRFRHGRREYRFRGANSWYWAAEDEHGFHRT